MVLLCFHQKNVEKQLVLLCFHKNIEKHLVFVFRSETGFLVRFKQPASACRQPAGRLLPDAGAHLPSSKEEADFG